MTPAPSAGAFYFDLSQLQQLSHFLHSGKKPKVQHSVIRCITLQAGFFTLLLCRDDFILYHHNLDAFLFFHFEHLLSQITLEQYVHFVNRTIYSPLYCPWGDRNDKIPKDPRPAGRC